ncbi:protein trichome birefringence [Cinnamomum micranthum f. kanehirae]|uniref:Protein trichome birefringence n=1 Tax=Cinnamomum micranthum f. kanehirae TaxID=337451 RepID=A0A3S3MK06_9MAGN|nr:protein trichome birefringence [Cinnamomum micranthum f. kanehirae]
MGDASKHQLPLGGTLKSLELKSFISAIHTRRRIKLFAYGFMISFIACTVFLAFNPSGSSSPWYNRIFFTSRSSSFFSFFFPQDRTTRSFNAESENPMFGKSVINSSFYAPKRKEDEFVAAEVRNVTRSSNATRSEKHLSSHSSANLRTRVLNYTEIGSLVRQKGKVVGLELEKCNVFDGRWVRDDSYPIYREGSCRHIDEPFNCFLNGRSDRVYQKLRWQPNGCNIPRLNGTDMLERLRGKRLVFVGDSLNRNMWESLVCVLGNDVEDKSKVFEASGRREFRSEGSYSFIFKDYNCSIEFFWSPFLVQEWENSEPNGTKKETLRLDVIERSSSKYKNADVIIFNTGHWWTHEKTSKGKDYYQEGRHIYDELNVEEAFRKALTTWARWVDANISPENTLVFFKGYSASHFSGGQWNSGGACDRETEPIKNETYLGTYPPTMSILESVIKGMRTPVIYLNITRMTDYRKDAHPSIYRKQNLTDEERRLPERYQDCSHWCLPGVPDTWNELLYAQLIVKQRH